jgi:hypothetical protein
VRRFLVLSGGSTIAPRARSISSSLAVFQPDCRFGPAAITTVAKGDYPIRVLGRQRLKRSARTGETDNRKTPKDVARDPGVSRTSQYSEHDALYRLDAEAV